MVNSFSNWPFHAGIKCLWRSDSDENLNGCQYFAHSWGRLYWLCVQLVCFKCGLHVGCSSLSVWKGEWMKLRLSVDVDLDVTLHRSHLLPWRWGSMFLRNTETVCTFLRHTSAFILVCRDNYCKKGVFFIGLPTWFKRFLLGVVQNYCTFDCKYATLWYPVFYDCFWKEFIHQIVLSPGMDH